MNSAVNILSSVLLFAAGVASAGVDAQPDPLADACDVLVIPADPALGAVRSPSGTLVPPSLPPHGWLVPPGAIRTFGFSDMDRTSARARSAETAQETDQTATPAPVPLPQSILLALAGLATVVALGAALPAKELRSRLSS